MSDAERDEHERLVMTLQGERRGRELLLKGMESMAELMDELKQRVRSLEAQNERLRASLASHLARRHGIVRG